MPENKSQFNILCLSGGGFRGLYTVKVLAEIEKSLGDNRRIAQCFNLISGTSIGGIIAIAIALEIPAVEIVEKFKLYGTKIFPPRPWFMSWIRKIPCMGGTHRLDFLYSHRSIYNNDALHSLVSDFFGEKVIGDLDKCLLIPTVNYSTGKPQIFKTPHHKNFIKDHSLKLTDIALATSAAPWYFPTYKIEDVGAYVDGGLYANDPSLLALHEAQHFLNQSINDINLLSVGTMTTKIARRTDKKLNMGLWHWKDDLFGLVSSAQEQVTNFQLKHILKNQYHKIDSNVSAANAEIIGLDKAGDDAIEILESEGYSAAQYFIGQPSLRKRFLDYHAEPPGFY